MARFFTSTEMVTFTTPRCRWGRGHRVRLLVGMGLITLMALPAPGRGQTGALVQLERVSLPNQEFLYPVEMTPLIGDAAGRQVIGYQTGQIRVIAPGQASIPTRMLLDLSTRTRRSGEEGLIGLALHPNYSQNGFFYVTYSVQTPSRATVLSRFTALGAGRDSASLASEQVLMTIQQPFSNHNGGHIVFGPDGFLYYGVGDGGSANDPQRTGQNTQTLLGKILRIDVDNPSGGRNYGIPADNPFASGTGGLPEIYAYGLRNPWKFSFDQATGRGWIADVGQNAQEEIDTLVRGGNYGWRVKEGTRCTGLEPSANCQDPTYIDPVWVYPHAPGDRSVTGGYVYRGSLIPYLRGFYLYGDYVSGRLWALERNAQGTWVNVEIARTTSPSTFGQDAQGEVYVLNYGSGRINRIIANPLAGPRRVSRVENVDLTARPNPAGGQRGSVQVSLPEAQSSIQVRLLDLKGKQVARLHSGPMAAGQTLLNVELKDLPAGTYVVEMESPSLGRRQARLVYTGR